MAGPEKHGALNRREFIRHTCGVAGGLALTGSFTVPARGGSSGTEFGDRPPNILMLMVDQMRYPLCGSAKGALDGIQRLRDDGMTFEAMYCSATPCTPSRATIFTGLHMEQHGLEINVCDQVPALNSAIPTLGHYFEHAGYRTPYFGKWHLSTKDEYEKNGVGLTPYGFEEWPGPDAQGTPNQGADEDEGIATQTIEWLNLHGHDPAPWLLTCSLVNPHDVMFYKRWAPPEGAVVPEVTDTLPANFDDDLSTKPRAHAQYQKLWGVLMEMQGGGFNAATTDDWLKAMDFYHSVAKAADLQIQRILTALDQLQLTDDTLVVFLSDHGEMAGAHRLMGKGPFCYEESVRVPLIVRWPGRVPRGVNTQSLAQTVDLLPTLLDLAGIAPSSEYLPGKSLKPILLDSPHTRVNDHVLMAYGMSIAAMVSEYAAYGATLPADYSPVPWKFHAIFDGTFKYARYFEDGTTDEDEEFYNHAIDAPELRNLVNEIAWRGQKKDAAARLQEAEQIEMAPIAPACLCAPFGPALTVQPASLNQVRLLFDTQKGIQYQVQATTDFAQWACLGDVFVGTGLQMEALVDTAGNRRFFRVQRL